MSSTKQDESRNILSLTYAGFGKSRTLAYNIEYFISKGEAPKSIIAFTFTEKAAESIKRRIAEVLYKSRLSEKIVGAMFIGTLGAFCQKLLGDINSKSRQFDNIIRELCGFTRNQAISTLDKIMGENILQMEGQRRSAR